MVMGTPQYLSPEQALGKAVDHRSDLYATGCLLYELLALRPPFTGETPLSVVYQHVQDKPVPPSQVSESCPPELDGLVTRSLAKEPDDRFQTAEEMRGLVQYGLQMLYEQGGHTGTWNTGPVDVHDGRNTPAAGLAGTTVMPHSADASGTTQIPQQILPAGYGSGDDGGFEGHGNKGSGRGKLWILAVLAVIAVVAGVALAIQHKGDGSGGSGTKESPTSTHSTKESKPSKKPTDEPTDEPTDTSTDNGSGAGTGRKWHPSSPSTPSYTPSETPSNEPTNEPTTPTTSAGQPSNTNTEPQTDPSQPATDPATGGDPGGPTSGDGQGGP
jgi:serine/threonine protein kinase